MRFIWLSLMLNIGLFTRSGRPVGVWALKREADLARPGRAGSCPEPGSERQACARPRRAGRPPRPAAASAGLRRGFDLGSSPRPAVPNLVGTRDRRSQENLLPGDLGRAEEAMLGPQMPVKLRSLGPLASRWFLTGRGPVPVCGPGLGTPDLYHSTPRC